jgi:hypothetical protein
MKFDEGVRRRRAGDEEQFSPCRGKSRATARNIAVTGDLASGSRDGAKSASEIRLILNSDWMATRSASSSLLRTISSPRITNAG